MSQPAQRCQRCGSTASRLSPGGVCPVCLLAACLASDAAGTDAAQDLPGDRDGLPLWNPEDARIQPDTTRRFRDYELFEELGRGAMGVVYRARQLSLGRPVAVKFLLAGPFASHEAIERFHVEATSAARLQHPNIVAIHEVGVHQGQRYLVMDYVPGQSLAEVMSDSGFQPLDFDRSVTWVKAIAQAVHYAHEQGILHRDLKPSNVLIDSAGTPHLTDFGLAKQLGPGTSLTLSGQVVGSPGYLPPEQGGKSGTAVSRASDVYSLGAILFQLLTGRPPFVGEDAAEVIRQVLESDPVSPRLIEPRVPRDLETLCLKCLEKEPRRRYATAQQFAEELERYLQNQPIHARPVSWAGRTRRWCRRRPTQAALAAALAMTILLGLAGVLWQWNRATKMALRESIQRARAEQTVYQLRIRTAEDHLRQHHAAEGLAVLAALLRENPADERVATWLMSELTDRNWPLPLLRPLEHSEPVHHAEFSPDGSRVLTAALDHTARLWDATTGLPIGKPMAHARDAHFDRQSFIGGQKCLLACFSPNGAQVATASVDGTARVWDGHSGAPITAPLSHPDWVTAAAFSPDGQCLATGCRDGQVRFWSTARGESTEPIVAHSRFVNFVEFDPAGRRLLTGADDGTAQVWDLATRKPIGAAIAHQGWVRDGQFSPDGRRVATASADGTARVWDAQTGEPLGPTLHHEGVVCRVRFSPDGATLATASFDQTVRLWDAETGAALSSPLLHGGTVRWLAFSPDGQRILTASEDNRVRIWEVRPARLAMEPIRHAAAVWTARFSTDGQRVVTASSDGTCGLWDVRPGAALTMELPAGRAVRQVRWSPNNTHLVAVTAQPCLFAATNAWSRVGVLWGDQDALSAAFSPDGSRIAVTYQDGTARLWEVARHEVTQQLRSAAPMLCADWSPDSRLILTASDDHPATVWSPDSARPIVSLQHSNRLRWAAFSPDSERVLTLTADDQIRVWERRRGLQLAQWRPHTAEITAAQFSPDGTRVLTASRDRTARLWNAQTGCPVGQPLAHRGVVVSATFSPAGQRVLTASEDNTAVVWHHPGTGSDPSVLIHEAPVHAARFDPSGRFVVTASQDRTARIWDAASGQPLRSPLSHPEPVRDAAFSPDGKWVATASGRSVRIWPMLRGDRTGSTALATLAEAVGGMRSTTPAITEPVTAAAFLDVRRRAPVEAAAPTTATWIRWFLADRTQRAAAPGTDNTIPELVRREEALAREGHWSSPALVRQLCALQPANGWLTAQSVRIALEDAASWQDPRQMQEAAWQTRRALELAPAHPTAWWAFASHCQHKGSLVASLEAIEHAVSLPGTGARAALANAQIAEQAWQQHAVSGRTVLAAYQRATETPRTGPGLDPGDRRLAWLGCARLHAILGERDAAHRARQQAYGLEALPPRAPTTPSRLVDLTEFYTADPKLDWRATRFLQHTLTAPPWGRTTFDGIEFDARGLIQLSSQALEQRRLHFPQAVTNIPIRLAARRLHFLHAADSVAPLHATVARYTVHLADGSQESLHLRYGDELACWDRDARNQAASAAVVWKGTSPAGLPVRLFRTTWTNPHPALTITALDLSAARSGCGVFVAGITAD